MLTRWKVGNFKSIRDEVDLALAPLTIFSGINSSGKSTLLQSILLLAQSFATTATDETLTLNGKHIKLGRVDDVLHATQRHQPMHIGFDWVPGEAVREDDPQVIHASASLNSVNLSRNGGKLAARLHVHDTVVAFGEVSALSANERPLDIYRFQAGRNIAESLWNRVPPTLRKQMVDGHFNYRLLNRSSEALLANVTLERLEGIALSGILPDRIIVSVDAEIAELEDEVNWIVGLLDRLIEDRHYVISGKDYVRHFPFEMHHLFELMYLPSERSRARNRGLDNLVRFREIMVNELNSHTLTRGAMFEELLRIRGSHLRILREQFPASLSKYESSRQKNRTHVQIKERLLPTHLMEPITQVKSIFSTKLYYLGPLRDDPRIIFAAPPLSELEQRKVGSKGQYTAGIIDYYRNLKLQYPLPPNKDFNGEFETSKGTLITALTVWLNHMGLIDNVDVTETPRVGYRLSLRDADIDKEMDLLEVGTGVSQVLPLLTTALLAPLDSIIIVEQPEVHLHPKVQSLLGDFLLAVSLMGKQCLVETHSEHLINRVRLRIAESKLNTVLPKVRIYFVERKSAASQFREVSPNEFGAILDWPNDFFDEAEKEASNLLRAQFEKRRWQGTKQ